MGEHAGFHEPIDRLTSKTMDMHRALVSLQEELEAIDWYRQRVDACEDEQLRAVLQHNLEEEVEHAAMVLEWLRRQDEVFDRVLRTYLFQEADILEVEARAESGEAPEGERAPPTSRPPRLTIGRLKGGR